MTELLQLSRHDRLLVFAPHPDDETLAAGALIQSARAAGASLRVVFATDGDNNPWPQRWLERRWRIGVAERARWGQRRRREAAIALAVLGVDPADARFLGWPDQGLTDVLMRDDAATATLAAEIADFAPTHVALPALGDRHPDHSALRVMLDIALLRAGSAATRLGYIVHGEALLANPRCIAVDARRDRSKREAMQAHASQIALSRRRLLDLAAKPERFDVSGPGSPLRDRETVSIHIAHRFGARPPRRHELLLVLATCVRTYRSRIDLAGHVRGAPLTAPLQDELQQAATIEWTSGGIDVTLPGLPEPLLAGYAKLHRTGSRLVIFDKDGWREAGNPLLATNQVIAGNAAASAG